MSIADKISRLNTAKNNIASAISSKGGTVGTGDGYEDFADDILTIPTAGNYQSKDVTYTSNGARTVTPDSGYDALSEVNVLVNVPAPEPVLQQKTVTPSTSQQIVRPDSGYDGLSQVTVNTDSNLVGSNIKNGVFIFGVNGNFTADADAVAADIISGKTAYVAGNKITGSIQPKAAQTFTPGTTDQIISAGQYLSGAQTILGSPNLVASNIKKNISLFGVTGTYSPEEVPITGSLIVCTFSDITRLSVRYGTAERDMLIVGNKAYATIPYTFTGNVYVDGYVGDVLFDTKTVTISAIAEYAIEMFASIVLYVDGVWASSIGSHTWRYDPNAASEYGYGASVTERATDIFIQGGIWQRPGSNDYTRYGVELSKPISKGNCSRIRVTFSQSTTGYGYFGYSVNPVSTAYPYYSHRANPSFDTVYNVSKYTNSVDLSTNSMIVSINPSDDNLYLDFIPNGTAFITKIELLA